MPESATFKPLPSGSALHFGNRAADIIRDLLSLIAARNGQGAITDRFCTHCEPLPHDPGIQRCSCICHRAQAYLAEHTHA